MYGNTRNFVIFFSVKQLISCPTRISCSSSAIVDHIITSYPDRVSQKGIIDTGICDHQLIFCTRKTLKLRQGPINKSVSAHLRITPLQQMLQDGAVILAKPVTKICNLSIKSRIFPDPCRLAKLKPIFKKGSRKDPSSYRRISLLPLISKIFEKIVHDQMIDCLAQYNILYKYQSRFRTRHATDLCLSYLTDKILKGFDNDLFTGMKLIDLKKAFDTIYHNVLLEN